MDYFYWIFNQFSFGEGAPAANIIRDWYLSQNQPFFSPEPFVFGLAWGLIYPLMAIALLWSLWLFVKKRVPAGFVQLFLLNIALNLTFTPTLIVTRDNALISLHIILVVGTLAWLMFFAYRFSKTVFILLLPYLFWGIFATILQISITALN